jgi:hypothetical protein
MSTELTVVERAVAALGKADKAKELVELAARSVTIKAITNGDGYKQVHSARMALKNERVEIEKAGKAARDDATKFSKAVIAEEKRLIGLILPEESRLEKLQQDYDDAIEEAKQAAIRAEQQRVAALQQRVTELSGALGVAKRYNLTAAEFAEHIADLERVPVDESFQEFHAEAEAAKAATLTSLRQMHATAVAREAEAARLKAEREELERQRETQAAENRRIAKIRADIASIRGGYSISAASTPDDILEQRHIMAAIKVEERCFDEFLPEAQEAHASALRALDEAYDVAVRREELASQERALAAERSAIERQQEEIRKAQEPPPAPPPAPPAPVSRRGVAVPVPKAAELIDVLAKHYRARPDTIIEWLRAVDWKQAEAA